MCGIIDAVVAIYSPGGNCPYFGDIRMRNREKESPLWEILGKGGLVWAEDRQKGCSGAAF